jgi:nitroreductase
MDVEEAIYTRRAIREFTGAPVHQDTIRLLIDAAIQAPSAVNQQPWSFRVVRDQSVLAQISAESKAHMLKMTPAGLLSHHFEQILNDPAFNIFYHAPVLIVICSSVTTPWATEDCALAAENLMLAAHAGGLGTCWIGFAQSWLGTPAGKSLLQLPADIAAMAPIIVGHPKSAPPAVPRRTPEVLWIG